MRIRASAPAKLVLLGEYAVLEGAPALVAAVDRRVVVDVDPFGGENWHYRTDLWQGRRAEVDWSGAEGPTVADHAAQDNAPQDAAAQDDASQDDAAQDHAAQDDARRDDSAWLLPALAVTREVLTTAGVRADQVPACNVHIRSTDLYEGAGRTKLGLGSSAAVVVALAEALRYGLRIWGLDKSAPAPLDAFQEDLSIHHEIKGGRGSGVDVAASFHGGLRTYDIERGAGEPLPLPEDVAMGVVWSGRSASTSSFLEQVAAARLSRPSKYEARIAALADASAAGIEACRSGQGAGLLDAVRRHHLAMHALGTLCGAEIVSAPHAELASIAKAQGHAYKASGAGGGDVGLLFAPSPEELRRTASLVEKAGYRLLDLAIDPAGVSVRRHERQYE